jgi:hypothetical protein
VVQNLNKLPHPRTNDDIHLVNWKHNFLNFSFKESNFLAQFIILDDFLRIVEYAWSFSLW